MIKAVSFDLDGTLINEKIDEIFWFEEIPKLAARTHKISYESAKKNAMEKYEEADRQEKDISWYGTEKWERFFNIKIEAEKMIKEIKERMEKNSENIIFPETLLVLKELKKRKIKLILITHSTNEFLKTKMEMTGIAQYFNLIISTISDMKSIKNDECYKEICRKNNLSPSEILHIGDSINYDVEMPKRAGMNCLLIDRKKYTPNSIENLKEVLKLV